MKYCIILLSFFFTTLSNASEMPRNDLAGPENINDLKVQIQWINPTAIRAYLNDTKTLLGEKSPALYEKLSRLETLLPEVQQALSGNVSAEAIDKARKVLALKREIILANPLLDMDKIIVARYRLGDKARKAMGPSMGTSTANYNSLFSNSRKGYVPKSVCSAICAVKSKVTASINRNPMSLFLIFSSTGMPATCYFLRLTKTGNGRSTK